MTEPEQPQQPDPAQGDDRDVIDHDADVVDPAEFPPADGEG